MRFGNQASGERCAGHRVEAGLSPLSGVQHAASHRRVVVGRVKIGIRSQARRQAKRAPMALPSYLISFCLRNKHAFPIRRRGGLLESLYACPV